MELARLGSGISKLLEQSEGVGGGIDLGSGVEEK